MVSYAHRDIPRHYCQYVGLALPLLCLSYLMIQYHFVLVAKEQVDTDLLEIEKGRVAVFRNAANALDSAGL